MTRTFDSGLVQANRTIVRNRVAELLAPLVRSNGGFLKAVTKIDAPLEAYDEDGFAQMFATLLGRAPAILVACGDRDVQPAGISSGFKNMSFLEVHLYFVNNSARSLLARAEADIVSAGDANAVPPIAGDDTADPGLDVAMQCVEELLIGQRLDEQSEGAVIKRLELKRERVLRVSNRLALWTQMYLVGVTRSINQRRGITQRLTGMNTTIRPDGEPAESPATTTFNTELE